ncbi:MAG: hypothetical protein Q9187_001308 [Circinaria calcarea]
MELRKKVNPPKRYMPELSDSPFEQRYVPPTDRPSFDIPYVDFNPLLPPAAFPTLDSAEVARRQSQANFNRNSKPLQNNRSDEHRFADVSPDNNSFSTAMPSPSTRWNNHSDTRQIRYAGLTEDNVETDLEHSNSIENPVYRQNLEMLGELQKRSKTEWNTLEMETSDEENGESEDEPFDVSGVKTETSANRGKRPEWGDVTVALRLEILSNLTEHGHTTLEAMQQLGLTQSQQDALNYEITLHNQRLEVEDTQLELLRMETHEKLLHGKLHIELAQLNLMRDGKHEDEAKERLFKGVKCRMNRFTQAGYKRVMENHLEGLLLDKDQANYSLTSTSALQRAQAYLKSKGMDVSLAGNWEKVAEGLGQAEDDNVPRRQPANVTLPSLNPTIPEYDLSLVSARSIYAEMIGENNPPNAGLAAPIQTQHPLSERYPSCIGPPQTTPALNSSQVVPSTRESAPGDLDTKSRELNQATDPSRRPANNDPTECAEMPPTLPMAAEVPIKIAQPLKTGIKRTSSGNEIAEKSGKNPAPKTPSNKHTEKKRAANPESTGIQASVEGDCSSTPARRRPTKLTLTTQDLETPAGPGCTASSSRSDPVKTLSQSKSDKPVRSPTARRLPARYSDSLPEIASSAGSSTRRSSYSKMVTEGTSPPQTASPLANSMSQASMEDVTDDNQAVAETTHAAVESQKAPVRNGRQRKTSMQPRLAESIVPLLGSSGPSPSGKGKTPAGRKPAPKSETPNPTPEPSSKAAPPKPKKQPARKTKK